MIIFYIHAFIYFFLINSYQDFPQLYQIFGDYSSYFIFLPLSFVFLVLMPNNPSKLHLLTLLFVAFHALMVLLGAKPNPIIDLYLIVWSSLFLVISKDKRTV